MVTMQFSPARRIEFESGLDFGQIFCRNNKNGSAHEFRACQMVSRGRDALSLIIERMGHPPGTGILLPALACEEVYRPFMLHGYAVHYYRVNRDLTPDMDQVRKLSASCKAILVINYYGFLQPQPVYAGLRQLGLTVIEDGSHSALTRGSGLNGDHYFASLRKLIPVPDGAVVRFSGGPEAGIKFNRFSLAAVKFRLARMVGMMLKKQDNRRPRRIRQTLTAEMFSVAEQALSRYQSPSQASCITKMVIASIDFDQIRSQRRANYQMLAGLLKGHKRMTVLAPDLPDDTVPYGLPVLVQDRTQWLLALGAIRVQAAPLWALSDIVPTSANADEQFHKQIMLLPIGQDYNDADMVELHRRIRCMDV